MLHGVRDALSIITTTDWAALLQRLCSLSCCPIAYCTRVPHLNSSSHLRMSTQQLRASQAQSAYNAASA